MNASGRTLIIACLMASGWAAVTAQPRLTRQVVATGGTTMRIATTTITGTIGQPIIQYVAAGGNRINQGFWWLANSTGPRVGVEDLRRHTHSLSTRPNPFGARNVVEYDLDTHVHVQLTVRDLFGHTLLLLVDEQQEPMRHTIEWDGRVDGVPVASGIYLYVLELRSATGVTATSTHVYLVR